MGFCYCCANDENIIQGFQYPSHPLRYTLNTGDNYCHAWKQTCDMPASRHQSLSQVREDNVDSQWCSSDAVHDWSDVLAQCIFNNFYSSIDRDTASQLGDCIRHLYPQPPLLCLKPYNKPKTAAFAPSVHMLSPLPTSATACQFCLTLLWTALSSATPGSLSEKNWDTPCPCLWIHSSRHIVLFCSLGRCRCGNPAVKEKN